MGSTPAAARAASHASRLPRIARRRRWIPSKLYGTRDGSVSDSRPDVRVERDPPRHRLVVHILSLDRDDRGPGKPAEERLDAASARQLMPDILELRPVQLGAEDAVGTCPPRLQRCHVGLEL